MPFEYRYALGSASHVGMVREINQDSVMTVALNCSFYDAGGNSAILAVADGVGGGPAGEVASKLAIAFFFRKFVESVLLRSASDLQAGMNSQVRPLLQSFELANAEVSRSSVQNPRCTGMATTLTAAFLDQGHCLIGHVGDSRCYLVRSGRIRLLTKDQSRGNVLSQAVGASMPLSVYSDELMLENNDSILVCSDGLTNMVGDESIADVVSQSSDPDQICAKLVNEANQRGGIDNITVALARVGLRFVP